MVKKIEPGELSSFIKLELINYDIYGNIDYK
jgi:hypothetical protein